MDGNHLCAIKWLVAILAMVPKITYFGSFLISIDTDIPVYNVFPFCDLKVCCRLQY